MEQKIIFILFIIIRGAVDNNLIFADICWKIVRTTETGGLKLIYNGTPTNGQCNNTGEASQIGTKEFNASYYAQAYVGYMYSSVYTYNFKTMSSITDTYYYGNDVTYSNGTYTLNNTITSSDWSSIYDGGLNNNHYTCFSTGTTCTNVYYIYNTSSNNAHYITLSDGEKVEDSLIEMLGENDEIPDNYNTISSTIKGSSTTEGTLDYWYYNNIELKGYSNYIEDTVWCNDRSTYQLGGWNPNGGLTTKDDIESYFLFDGYERLTNSTPDLTCSRNIDSFTVSESNGNGDLDYPVGLLTLDEVMLAGATGTEKNDTYYLYTGQNYWINSPTYFNYNGAVGSRVNSDGTVVVSFVSNERSIRPSISLKQGFNLIDAGDGSSTNPYVVE